MEKYATLRVQERPEGVLLVTLDRPDLLPERRPELERRRELWPL